LGDFEKKLTGLMVLSDFDNDRAQSSDDEQRRDELADLEIEKDLEDLKRKPQQKARKPRPKLSTEL
jgi:hypothetical protein